MENVTVRVRSYSNLHCPLEESPDPATKCKVGSGYISVLELDKFSDEKNVRGFLPKENPVSQAIKSSFRNETDMKYPDKFAVLNGGVTVFAKRMGIPLKVFDEKKVHVGWDLALEDPNVINGAQTRGLIMDLLKKEKDETVLEKVRGTFVRYEVLVSEDEDLADEVSVTRNSQTEVQLISILNKEKVFSDLKASMREASGGKWEIRENETHDYTSDPPWLPKFNNSKYVVDTERLVQLLIAMTPDVLLDKLKGTKKLPAAQHSTRLNVALNDFNYCSRDPKLQALYDFYVQFAPTAWLLWQEWCYFDRDQVTKARTPILPDGDRPGNWWKTDVRTDDPKRKTRSRVKGVTVLKDKSQDGLPPSHHIVNGTGFPIMSALSRFCVQRDGRWTWECPEWFDKAAKIQFMERSLKEASGGANDFGHRKDAYDELKFILKEMVDARSSQEKDAAIREKDEFILKLQRENAALKKKR